MPQVQLLDGDFTIDEELSLFTNITGRRFWPQSNIGLVNRNYCAKPQNTATTQAYEQTSADCTHHANTLPYTELQDQFDHEQCLVITLGEETSIITRTAEELCKLPIKFYTGHCTGQAAYDMIKPIMGEKLWQISAGIPIR